MIVFSGVGMVGDHGANRYNLSMLFDGVGCMCAVGKCADMDEAERGRRCVAARRGAARAGGLERTAVSRTKTDGGPRHAPSTLSIETRVRKVSDH
jgi:hypothetical protein